MKEQVVTKVVAVAGGIASGVSVHYLSLAFGCTVTLPGVLWATAVATLILSRVRWDFTLPDPPESKQP